MMFRNQRISFRRYRQQAYSLIEIAIVLAIFGVVLGGLWVVAGQAWEYTKREQAREAIALTVSGVRDFYAAQAGVPNLGFPALSAQLLDANAIPHNLKRAAGCAGTSCADNPWGPIDAGTLHYLGTFRVCSWVFGVSTSCPQVAPGVVSGFFGIELTGLTKKSCIALVQSISSASGPSGLADVAINVTQNPSTLVTLSKPIQPVTYTDATTFCTTADDGYGIVSFVYRLRAATL